MPTGVNSKKKGFKKVNNTQANTLNSTLDNVQVASQVASQTNSQENAIVDTAVQQVRSTNNTNNVGNAKLNNSSRGNSNTTSRRLADQLHSMLEELNEKDLSELPAEEILKLRKDINPYGRTIQGSDKYMNFSITQIHHEYWKKFIITAFVGFLNRMNDEWKVPEGVPVVSVYDYIADNSLADTPKLILDKGDKNAIYDYEFNRKWMEKRIAVKEFLEEYLQFNPDEHVRSAHRPNRGDKSRKPINTPAGKLATEHLKKVDKEFRDKEALHDDIQDALAHTNGVTAAAAPEKEQKTKTVKKTVIGKDGTKKVVIKKVPVDDFGNEITPVDLKKKLVNGKDPTVTSSVRELIPPHDTFGRFKTYYQSNYEELRDAVKDLYCEKPELELAINPYSWHDTPEEAEMFKKKHRNEVIAEIFTAHSGKWNFFDSFKEQRDNVNFYNDNTIILEEMIKQQERDERLGQDLMKKRIDKMKKKNIIEAGPDAESFKKWRAQNSELSKLGASHIGDMASDECPPDGIEVPVWKIAKGGLELTRDKFYSQAEAPTFVKEAQDRAMATGSMAPSKPESVETTEKRNDAPKLPTRSDNLE